MRKLLRWVAGLWVLMGPTPQQHVTKADSGFVNRGRPYDQEHRRGVPYNEWGF